ncbi:MAG: hypothetical protein IPK97_21300 [Ahniella sp.]|nr:hypothetical protein [Ahniella sp.]
MAQINLSATAGTPAASYTTLKGAFDAINAGTHQGAIAISVTGNTTELATAVLAASGSGAATYSGLAITPSGGATRGIGGSLPGPLIDLDGADNVTINGLNSGGNALILTNLDTSATASTLRFINDASNNNISNVTLRGSGTDITQGVVVLSTGTTTGNDNNSVSNCSIVQLPVAHRPMVLFPSVAQLRPRIPATPSQTAISPISSMPRPPRLASSSVVATPNGQSITIVCSNPYHAPIQRPTFTVGFKSPAVPITSFPPIASAFRRRLARVCTRCWERSRHA